MNPFKSDDGTDEGEEEYICKACEEPWEGEATAFYVEGRCENCGAAGGTNRVPAESHNPLTEDDE